MCLQAPNTTSRKDVVINARFINEAKVDVRLNEIFDNDTMYKLSWRLGQLVIENAPFSLLPVSREHAPSR